jgi:hypothetical protein
LKFRDTPITVAVVASRQIRILLLALLAAWFGVLLPVHVRGQIKVPGAAADAATSCCSADRPADDCSDFPAGSNDCAVCHYLAGLDLPVVFTFDVRPLGRTHETLRAALTSTIIAPSLRLPSDRAPPVDC